jgi:hypothetical protein
LLFAPVILKRLGKEKEKMVAFPPLQRANGGFRADSAGKELGHANIFGREEQEKYGTFLFPPAR